MKLHLYNHPEEVRKVKIVKVGSKETIHVNGEFYGFITSTDNGILATKTSGLIDELPSTLLFTLKKVEKNDLIKRIEDATGLTLEEVREVRKFDIKKYYDFIVFCCLYIKLSSEKYEDIDLILGRKTKGQGMHSVAKKHLPTLEKDKEFKKLLKELK
jgi:hypothetical protein